METLKLVLGVAILGIIGCSSTPAEPSSRTASRDQTVEKGRPGYQHVADRSAFRAGNNSFLLSEQGYSKVVGDQGVFAVDETNGSAMAIPNGDASSLNLAPYGSTSAEHGARVRSYFVSAGIPESQVAFVQPNVMVGGAENPAEEQTTAPRVIAWYSSLGRSIDGIPVVDSIAWARFNIDDEVVSETVYWPSIDESVVDAAKALQAKLSTQSEKDALFAHLSAKGISEESLTRIRVAIRHAPFTTRNSFYALACVEAVQGKELRHFDGDAHELRLLEEVVDEQSEEKP